MIFGTQVLVTGSLLFFSGLIAQVSAAFPNGHSVVQYWGQNSAGLASSQKNLAFYCDSNTDVVIVSFAVQFNVGGFPTLNFANSCVGPTFAGTSLLKCDKIGQDIKTCQSKGKKILLSLGGASGAYGFNSDSDAKTFAKTLWNLFGAGNSKTRPFGTAVIDGFDLDIEGGSSTGYVALVKELRSLFKKDASKNYYITAAPQCPYPDAILGTVIDSVGFDAVNVQFYNNYCALGTSSFNFDTWDKWAKKTSPNKKVKVFIGIPGSTSAAGSGYIPFANLKTIVNQVKSKYSSYGGIVIWDASQSYKNTQVSPNYATAVAKLVHGSSKTTTKAKAVLGTSKLAIVTNTSSSLSSSDVAAVSVHAGSCAVEDGAACSVEGQYMCTHSGVVFCNNGEWVVEPCAPGLGCLPSTDGQSAYCAPISSTSRACSASQSDSSSSSSSSSSIPKAYISTATKVTAQLSVINVTETTFEAAINARRTDTKPFGHLISVQITMPPNITVSKTSPHSTVNQLGRLVQLKIRNPNAKSMAIVVLLQGHIESGGVYMAPDAKNIKFLS